jgi:uncharacterized alkaline shock family protein YloU
MTISRELAAPPGTEPAERGRLDIGPAVLRKIVEHVADRTPGTLRGARRVTGLEVGQTGSTAKVGVGAELVDIALELGVRYPASVAETVAEVRQRVTREVTRITGHRVRRFDVTVSGLYRAETPRLT